jgi:uncharacterized membrane protein YeaQ/YmgE (transglycosylase-associated protein family)
MSVISFNYLSLSLSDSQESSILTFITWIGIGLLVGYLGSKILNKTDYRLFRYVLLSTLGALIGGYLAQLLGTPGVTGIDLYSMIVAIVGAGVFLIVYHAIFRRKRFLDMH